MSLPSVDEISRDLPRSAEALSPLLARMAEAVRAAVDAESCEIWIWRAQASGHRSLHRAGLAGLPRSTADVCDETLNSGPLGALADHRAPREPDHAETAHFVLGPFGFVTVARTIGSIAQQDFDEIRAWLVLLADAVGARFPQTELAEINRWLLVRADIDRRATRAFARVQSLKELASTIDGFAEETVPVEYSGLYFLDPDTQVLRLLFARGLSERERRAAEETAESRHPGEVIRTGRAIDIVDTEERDGENAAGMQTRAGMEGHGQAVRSRLFIPVWSEGSVVGTIGFASSSRASFSARHRQVLEFLADFAGLAYARIVADRANTRRGALLEAGIDATERLLGASDWKPAAYAALAMIGSAMNAGTIAMLELAAIGGQSRDAPDRQQPLEFVWQPTFGNPWIRAERIAHATEEERAHLTALRAVTLQFDDGAPPAILKPVIVDGVLWGVIVHEPRPGTRRELDRAERSALRGLGQAFATAIARERVDQLLRHRQQMEAVGQLAAGIAHDFNNLLWPILLYSEMLERNAPLDERSQQMVRDMHTAARSASVLVQQVLAISRRRDRMVEIVHVPEIAIEVSNTLRRNAPAKVRITAEIDADAGQVLGDSVALQQALMNLGTHAIDSIGDQSGSIRFEVSAVTRGGQRAVRVVVVDDGPGMTRDVCLRAFEPYVVADSVERPRSGLGLSVAHRIVTEMDGSISVESSVGGGTRFEVLLPLIAADRAPSQQSPARTAAKIRDNIETRVSAIGLAAQLAHHVLFVDDDALVRDVGREMLEMLGYRVTVCAHSEEVLAAIGKEESSAPMFSLLLTDLTMPGMNGIDLAREVRARRPTLPIVCCSGFVDPETERRGFEAGMCAFVRKPINFDTLDAAVKKAIHEARAGG